MSEGSEVFKAVIGATDEASPALARIKQGMVQVHYETTQTGNALEHFAHGHSFKALHEHIGRLHEGFVGVGHSVTELGGSLADLLPAIGAIGAAGSIAGLFETVEHTAEAYGQLAHTAVELGVSAQQLHEWNSVATLADVSAESFSKSMVRLNRSLFDVSHGKNKELAGLFKHLHLNPKSFKDSADALPALADAFERNTSATWRAKAAFDLFGKSGADLIPLLAEGRAGIEEFQKEAKSVSFNFAPHGDSLEAYNHAMKRLKLSATAFTDELGAKLSPVLEPIVNHMERWVTANRDWVTSDIVQGVKDFDTWVEHLPLEKMAGQAERFAGGVNDLVQDFGGWETAIELVAGAWAANKGMIFIETGISIAALGGKIVGLTTHIGQELVGAWDSVGAAAARAATKEEGALAVGSGGAGAAEAAGGAAVAGGASKVGWGSRLATIGEVGLARVAGLVGIGLAIHEVSTHILAPALAGAMGYDPDRDQSRANMRAGTGRGFDRGPHHVYSGYGHPAIPALPLDDSPGYFARILGTVEAANEWNRTQLSSTSVGLLSDRKIDGLNAEVGKLEITVKVSAPPGTQVESVSAGSAPRAKITNTGQAWHSTQYHR